MVIAVPTDLKPSTTSADTLRANMAVYTRYIIVIIFCLGVSGQFVAPIVYSFLFVVLRDLVRRMVDYRRVCIAASMLPYTLLSSATLRVRASTCSLYLVIPSALSLKLLSMVDIFSSNSLLRVI